MTHWHAEAVDKASHTCEWVMGVDYQGDSFLWVFHPWLIFTLSQQVTHVNESSGWTTKGTLSPRSFPHDSFTYWVSWRGKSHMWMSHWGRENRGDSLPLVFPPWLIYTLSQWTRQVTHVNGSWGWTTKGTLFSGSFTHDSFSHWVSKSHMWMSHGGGQPRGLFPLGLSPIMHLHVCLAWSTDSVGLVGRPAIIFFCLTSNKCCHSWLIVVGRPTKFVGRPAIIIICFWLDVQ